MMKYQDITPIDRAEAEAAFRGNDLEQTRVTLVRVACHEPDYEWAQERCIDFCNHDDAEVRGVAVTCLGHIARVHGKLDMRKVMPVLHRLLNDPLVAGRVEDALSDIKQFAG